VLSGKSLYLNFRGSAVTRFASMSSLSLRSVTVAALFGHQQTSVKLLDEACFQGPLEVGGCTVSSI
jgi:hypothetical protein